MADIACNMELTGDFGKFISAFEAAKGVRQVCNKDFRTFCDDI